MKLFQWLILTFLLSSGILLNPAYAADDGDKAGDAAGETAGEDEDKDEGPSGGSETPAEEQEEALPEDQQDV